MVEISTSTAQSRATNATDLSAVLSRAQSGGRVTVAGNGRVVADNVDLSDVAKLAAEFRAGGTDGDTAERLTSSLQQARQITDNFVSQFQSQQDSGSTNDFATAVREEVGTILREGKPASIIDRIVKRLFG